MQRSFVRLIEGGVADGRRPPGKEIKGTIGT